MRDSARKVGIALAIIIAGSILGACANGASRSQSSATTTSTTHMTTTTIPTTTSTTTATTCQPSQLRSVLYGSEGAAGTIELTFSFTNTSNSLCTMHGYPGMQLVDASGDNLPTVVIRGGTLAFENVATTDVTLAPLQMAYFNLGFNDVATGTTTCSVATKVEITPPNDVTYVVVPVASQIEVCDGGTLYVSPVFSSTDTTATGTMASPTQSSQANGG